MTNLNSDIFQEFEKIAIFGSADVSETSEEYQQAFIVSQFLADAGVTIVNGGGPGIMQAATMGAQSKSGKTLTVTFEPKNAPFFEGKDTENHSDQEIITDNYPERMLTLIKESDAFVIMKGGTGTLSEWATAWLMAHIYYGHHKPIVMLGDFWHEVMAVIEKNFYIADEEKRVYRIVSRAEDVVPALQKLEAELLDTQRSMS